MANSLRSLVFALWIIAFAAARIISTYPLIGITFDEPAHLACGMQFLAQHKYEYEPQHPPLARAAAALGPYLSGVRPGGIAYHVEEGVTEFYQDGRTRWHLVLDRAGVLPFFLLASLVVFWWTRRHFGGLTGVLAVAIFTLIPSVLGHAGIGTTDMALTACLGAAFLALIACAERPTWRRGAALGFATALAVLSKFTALAYLPASTALAFAAWMAVARPHPRHLLKLARERAASFGIAAATAAFVIWAGYLFSFGPALDWGVSLPAPELFAGLYQAAFHNEMGHPAFFFGQRALEGWWYFFPVMLLLKTPIAALALGGVGLAEVWKRRRDPRCWLPVALIAGTLLPGMAGRINIGTRHVLPVYVGGAILAALGAERMLRGLRSRWAAVALLVWLVVSGATHHPDYLSYFNELAPHPETIVADSDLDWGQGSVLLKRRLDRLGVAQATCSFFNLTPERLREWPGLDCKPLEPRSPATGWVAVSPTAWRVTQYGVEYTIPDFRLWFEDWKPVARVGGLLLYYNPPEAGRGAQ